MLDVICPVKDATVAVSVAHTHKALDKELALSKPLTEDTLQFKRPDDTAVNDPFALVKELIDPTSALRVAVETPALTDAVLVKFNVVPVMTLKAALLPVCRGAVLVPAFSCPALT